MYVKINVWFYDKTFVSYFVVFCLMESRFRLLIPNYQFLGPENRDLLFPVISKEIFQYITVWATWNIDIEYMWPKNGALTNSMWSLFAQKKSAIVQFVSSDWRLSPFPVFWALRWPTLQCLRELQVMLANNGFRKAGLIKEANSQPKVDKQIFMYSLQKYPQRKLYDYGNWQLTLRIGFALCRKC